MPLATLLALLSPTWADSLMAMAAGGGEEREEGGVQNTLLSTLIQSEFRVHVVEGNQDLFTPKLVLENTEVNYS